MNTLKTMGKRMKPIFVFVLLEALLAGFLIGCQTQGLDLDGFLITALFYLSLCFNAWIVPVWKRIRRNGDVAFWLLSPFWSSGCCMTCAG